jgi:hypothetical protein
VCEIGGGGAAQHNKQSIIFYLFKKNLKISFDFYLNLGGRVGNKGERYSGVGKESKRLGPFVAH